MNQIRRTAVGSVLKYAGVDGLADDEAVLLASTASVDRMGDIVVQEGIGYQAWLSGGGVICRDHDISKIVARTLVADIKPAGFTIGIKFTPRGMSAIADETRNLVKGGFLTGVSIGFLPVDWEMINPNRPNGGIRFNETEIIEVSLVGAPANRESLVIGKAWRGRAAPVERRAPSTLDYGGTYTQRKAQLAWDHPWLEREAAQREMDRARAQIDTGTREGRIALVAAYRRYIGRG
jgi:HK97 family phage prohead protease